MRGERVFLRHPVQSDCAEYAALRQASREWLEPWEPIRPGGFLAVTHEQAFREFVADSNTERRQRFLVCESASNAIVGQVALSEIIRGPLQQSFLGYWIGKPYAGRGLMSESLRLILSYGFDMLKLHRIEANIQPHNERSIALVRRLGMRKEGFSPRYLEIAGEWSDHERWAMTAEDHAAIQ